jgi:hypothetical protein
MYVYIYIYIRIYLYTYTLIHTYLVVADSLLISSSKTMFWSIATTSPDRSLCINTGNIAKTSESNDIAALPWKRTYSWRIYWYINTYVNIYIYIHTCIYIYIYVYICICTYIYIYDYIYMHIYIYTYTYIYIYIYIYIYTGYYEFFLYIFFIHSQTYHLTFLFSILNIIIFFIY